jgi:hypothetical protein
MLTTGTLHKGGGYVLTVDPSISILVSLSDHLIDLVISQLLSNGCHDMTEFSGRDESIVVTIKDLDHKV